jgi:hypothetical protein
MTSHRKNLRVTKCHARPRNGTYFSKPVAGCCKYGNEPSGSVKDKFCSVYFFTSCVATSFSSTLLYDVSWLASCP